MGWQIIKQPNNNYCVYSSVLDHLVFADVNEDELKEFYKEEAGRRGVNKVDDVLRDLDEGKKPYFQFTMTFDEMVESVKRCMESLSLSVREMLLYMKRISDES